MKFAFIGSGKMAGALVQGVVQSGAIAAADILVPIASTPQPRSWQAQPA
jgi:pyrroline-5-carboxylate reductase